MTCKYNHVLIPNLSEDLDLYVEKPGVVQPRIQIQRYAAPLKDQINQRLKALSKRALRTLRELPICEVTGLPVEVSCGYSADYLIIAASYWCRNCYGVDVQEAEVAFAG